MKILFLNYEFPPIGGGASPVSLEIARGYVSRGHHVDVITMSYRDLPDFEIIDGVNVYRVKSLRSKKEICHPWEQLTYLFSAWRFLSRRLKKFRYDINHSHFIIPTGVLALWVKKKYNIPYVLTSHGSDVLGQNKRFALLYPFLKTPWLKIIKNAKYVTAPSDYQIQKIMDITQDGTFKTIANGLDLSRFKPMKKEKKILVVARLFQNKGIQDILDALKGIDLGGWRVDIVGDGPFRNILMEKAYANGLKDTVRFLGWIDNDSMEMKKLYGTSSIFISASYFESFGLTVLEAVSAGCYPLISDIGGHRFIINDDRFFFQKENIEDLRLKLDYLIKHKIVGLKINIKRFSWSNVIKDYISLLEN
jgi:glycosyltransferase involved in cell wall biosynthesis